MSIIDRDTLKATAEWQALNNIWKKLSPEIRSECSDEFKLLTDFIRKNTQAKPDFSQQDSDYKILLSESTREFATARENEGNNIYLLLMNIISKSTFESTDKFMIYFNLKYKNKFKWYESSKSEFMEILNLVWSRLIERGFVPGEGFNK